MRIHETRPLFAWESLEDEPSLKTLREFLESVRDGRLLESLRSWRGRGRDDYPVEVLWGVLLLTIVLRHPTIEGCLEELGRNEGLRRMIGIQTAAGVPKKWNMSRFLDVLGREPHLTLLREVFDTMVARLGEKVGDLGRHTSGDSTGLSAQPGRGKKTKKTGRAQPDGGRKEYLDENGNVAHVVEWFGYKLHLVVDARHEVSLAYRITPASEADCEQLTELVTQARGNLPKERIKTLAYDRAADDEDTHELLNESGIRPVIENRGLWKEDPERMLPGHDGRSNVVYDESGTLYCYNKVSTPPIRQRMAYIGHEPSRGTLKYRCPARHGGWKCPSDERCNGSARYGKTVRVKQEINLRRFPAIPRATKQFERLYRGRTAVERVNARLKIFWGADDGNITGANRFHAYVGAVMVVHIGLAGVLAQAPRWEGTLGTMRLDPIAKALRQAQSPPSG